MQNTAKGLINIHVFLLHPQLLFVYAKLPQSCPGSQRSIADEYGAEGIRKPPQLWLWRFFYGFLRKGYAAREGGGAELPPTDAPPDSKNYFLLRRNNTHRIIRLTMRRVFLYAYVTVRVLAFYGRTARLKLLENVPGKHGFASPTQAAGRGLGVTRERISTDGKERRVRVCGNLLSFSPRLSLWGSFT